MNKPIGPRDVANSLILIGLALFIIGCCGAPALLIILSQIL